MRSWAVCSDADDAGRQACCVVGNVSVFWFERVGSRFTQDLLFAVLWTLAVDAQDRLWIFDGMTNRVLRHDTPLVEAGPDLAPGQATMPDLANRSFRLRSPAWRSRMAAIFCKCRWSLKHCHERRGRNG